VVVTHQQRAFDRESPPKIVKQLAQVGAGLGIRRLRPKKGRELLTGLHRFAVQHKKRQQRSHTVGVDRCDQTLPECEAQCAQQFDANRSHF
jgi:hypothetical protein